MRKVHLAAAAFASLAGPAFAADLTSQKGAPVYVAPPPVFSWTGFYAGADVGGGWGDHDATVAASPMAPAQAINTHVSGVIGGGFAGYNYQINQFVIGVQGDFQGLGVSGSTFSDSTSRVQGDWFGAINGRLGFALFRLWRLESSCDCLGAKWHHEERRQRSHLRRELPVRRTCRGASARQILIACKLSRHMLT